MPKRLLVDFKTNCHDEITGRLDMSADSVFVLEALAMVIDRFSESCGIPALEILEDLKNLVTSPASNP